jgi:hypothetical protein
MHTLYGGKRISSAIHVSVLLTFLLCPFTARADSNVFHNSFFQDTVYDATSGLIWTKSSIGPKTWVEALEYVSQLNNLSFDGSSDWRLPSRKELKNIVDHHFQPVINTHFFPDTTAGYYWSSSTYKDSSHNKWCVSMADGKQRKFSATDSNNKFYVRVVRGGEQREAPDRDHDGFTEYDGDCDDDDDDDGHDHHHGDHHPGGTEICDDGIDQDCNGSDLECSGADVDNDGDGYTENQGDCDDTNAAVNLAASELCDGVDNNCNGSIDEGLTQPTTCGLGQCGGSAGIETCANGVWENDTCDPFAGAAAETCNNIDDDCDGTVDEDLTQSSTCGAGVCSANTGIETCTAGAWGNDTCDPLAGAIAEICNSIDDDCDGTVDEDLTRETTCGAGACSGNTGIETCTAGVWGIDTCDPLAGATAEICNNADDDCDGTVDEELTQSTACGEGACSGNAGIKTCTAGVWGIDTCDPFGGAAVETCNNADDDCDGTVDEELTQSTTCGEGACSGNAGIKTCTAGVWGIDTCEPLAGATAETCNNADDDCDGTVDDGIADIITGTDAGECRIGIQSCIGGVFAVTQPEISASSATCNGLDNDCDGFVDDEVCPVKLLVWGGYYNSIQGAYDDAIVGEVPETVQIQDRGEFVEDLILDGEITVTLKGGYDESFNEPTMGPE